MMPHSQFLTAFLWLRRIHVLAIAGCTLALLPSVGCVAPLFRGQSPEPDELTKVPPELEMTNTKLVGDIANAWGMSYQKIESIALATGLDNTGSDPPPSPQRQMLLDEMKTHDVKDPNKLLASPSTSMVLLRAYLPPGVQKGDRFDVEVRVPSRSETSSLRGGWIMQSRMKTMEVLGGSIRQGHVIGLAEGPVVVDAAFKESDDKVLLTRGRLLGGGVSQISRGIGLVVQAEESSIRTATLISQSINTRFHTFDHGKKVGVANPKRDNFIDLAIPTRYKNNIWRYVRVVRAIALKESPTDRIARIRLLDSKLAEPTTAHEAAIQLEAIGKEAIPVLKHGLESPLAEVRFAAAEALAYLDEAEAGKGLAEAAKNTSAFRWSSLMALASMDQVSAYDALNELLHVPSAETRYGALRSIRQRNPRDPLVRGEFLGEDRVSFHVVNTTSEPMVHFAKSMQPEIVLFGADLRIKPPVYLYAGKKILLKGIDADRVKLIRYVPGQEDQTEIVSTELAQLLPMLFKLGADYTDVMQCLLKARKDGYLDARIAIDAVPKPGRVYYRDSMPDDNATDDGNEKSDANARASQRQDDKDSPGYEPDFNREKEQPAKKGILGRFSGWFTSSEPE